METTSPLERAVQKLGGQSATARALNVSQASVWYWLKHGKVSAEYTPRLAQLAGLAAHELRPDIFPPPVAQSEKAGAA
ncbi:MAG: YdaS family helix-turn-helix protein [Magnetospirillum sp.]|nr:YdaS family helix-turn-helix protein [Magnetospirillum sp.]